MLTTLDYGRDDVLRDDDERELGRVRYSQPGVYMAVQVEELKYDVVRRRRHGWDFTLMQASAAEPLCEFHPYRLREGGGLAGPAITVELKHKLWTGDWRIAGLGGPPIVVSHAGAHGLKRRVRRLGGLRGPVNVANLVPKLELVSESPLAQTRETIPVLVFACWLIVQWEGIPAVAMSAGGP